MKNDLDTMRLCFRVIGLFYGIVSTHGPAKVYRPIGSTHVLLAKLHNRVFRYLTKYGKVIALNYPPC